MKRKVLQEWAGTDLEGEGQISRGLSLSGRCFEVNVR